MRPERWAYRLLEERTTTVLVFVLIAAVVRTGFGEYQNPVGIRVGQSLPEPIAEYRGGTILSPIIGRLLGINTYGPWTLLHAVLTVGLVLLAGVMIWRRFENRSQRLFVFIALAASSIPVVSLMHVGHYDLWFVAGAFVLGLGRSYWTAVAGAVLIGLTNAEQGVIALAVLVAVVALVDRPAALRAITGLVTVAACGAAIRGWYYFYGVDQTTRGELFASRVEQSIENFTRSLPVQVYSWFSAAWLVVVTACRTWLVFAALVALPALMTMTTLDGTRVFVMCAAPAFVFLLAHAADTLGDTRLERLTAWTLIVMCVTPGLSTFSAGQVEEPLKWLVEGGI